MIDARTPVLVGVGQLTQRDVEPAAALEPLALMVEAARQAADDAGAGAALLARLDTIAVVNILSWPYGNAPGLLGERLGAKPTECLYSTVGGNTPQWFVNETAAKIAGGTVDAALLAGAETVRTMARARRAHVALEWTSGGPGSPTTVGETRDGTTSYEADHGLVLPTAIYPLFENALRAAAGRSIAEHQRYLGALMSRFAAVAAENPHAWFREPATADELMTVTPQNRYIGFPYPKRLNAIIDVDQSAAVLMTSVATARELGIPESRWVYVWGTGDAHDHWYVSDRVGYARSPAIREAGRQALTAAGVGIDAIEHFDIYSCFPSAVQLGRDALGIPVDDPRPLTVTGGLAYFGGPGNNYTMHGIAEICARLRADRDALGLVTGLGWYVTKHSVGVYGGRPKDGPFTREDPKTRQTVLDAEPSPAVVEKPEGRGRIETYTVLHDREGAPIRGLVIGLLDDGRRFLANTPADRDVLEGLETREGVGLPGRVTPGETNRFDPA